MANLIMGLLNENGKRESIDYSSVMSVDDDDGGIGKKINGRIFIFSGRSVKDEEADVMITSTVELCLVDRDCPEIK